MPYSLGIANPYDPLIRDLFIHDPVITDAPPIQHFVLNANGSSGNEAAV